MTELIAGIICLLMIIGSTVFIACNGIIYYNLKKHGCWWGNLPKWASRIVDFFGV